MGWDDDLESRAHADGGEMTEVRAGQRAFQAVAAAIGWAGLIVQFVLTWRLSLANGLGEAGAVARFLIYFTILTNILVAVSLTFRAAAPESRGARWFADPVVATGVLVAIVLVGLIYLLLLRALWHPTGAQKLADSILHDVTPLLLIVDWVRHTPKGQLSWRHLPRWCLYPLGYAIYAMAAGSVSGFYPYPFIDLRVLSPVQALINALGVLVVVAILGVAAWRIDAVLARTPPRSETIG